MLNCDSIFWNFEPGPSGGSHILDHEFFETVEFQFAVRVSEPYSFDLESEAVLFGIPSANDFSLLVRGDVQKSILEYTLNALEHIFDLQWFHLCDVKLLGHNVEVLLCDRIYFDF